MTINYQSYFPRGVAFGDAFCNREAERSRVKNNMLQGQHTLLMSPRRYGKTSLVKYAVEEIKLPFGEADLFVAVDARRVEQRILAGVNDIIQTVSSSLEQALNFLVDYFKKSDKQWQIGAKGMKLSLSSNNDQDPAGNILDALRALESFLQKKKQRAVLFIDEVQEISEIAEGKGIEGAIRNIAQQTKYLSFVFSGSNRRLLSQMFYDKSRPLYKLCDRINLDRISKSHYREHINKFSKKRWSHALPEETLDKILNLAELHPYYINGLCLKLWESSFDRVPNIKQVEEAWLMMLEEERLEIIRELDSLSFGQKKILISIAQGYNNQLLGKASLQRLNISASSVNEGLKVLEKKDYLQKQEDDTYIFLDPLIKKALIVYFGNN